MPCGGIYPVPGSWVADLPKPPNSKPTRCWQCHKSEPTPEHFCDEWDTFIHARCVAAFLQGEEGKIVISHEHSVLLDFSLEKLTAAPE